MIRSAILLVCLAAIGMTLVHLRREETAVRHDMHRQLGRQTQLRRKVWDRRTKVAQMIAPKEIRHRAREMAIRLEDESGDKPHLARAEENASDNRTTD